MTNSARLTVETFVENQRAIIMKDWIIFALTLPFMLIGFIWRLIVRGFNTGAAFADYLNDL